MKNSRFSRFSFYSKIIIDGLARNIKTNLSKKTPRAYQEQIRLRRLFSLAKIVIVMG